MTNEDAQDCLDPELCFPDTLCPSCEDSGTYREPSEDLYHELPDNGWFPTDERREPNVPSEDARWTDADEHYLNMSIAERRERYAAAIEAATDEWENGEPTTLTREERIAGYVMTVADEETARKDREYATCERLLRESYEENARLRAELDAIADALNDAGIGGRTLAHAVRDLTAQRDGHDDRAAEAEATIARVESVLEDHSSHRDTGDLANSLYNVLEGEQP